MGYNQVRGSSPLTRGKYRAGLGLLDAAGLIPAHAGKIPAGMTANPSGSAHPRSRGENAARIEVRDWPAGSSPLTRGK